MLTVVLSWGVGLHFPQTPIVTLLQCFFFFFHMNRPKPIRYGEAHASCMTNFKMYCSFFSFFPHNLHQSLISQFLRSFNPQQWSKTQWNTEVGPDESESWWIRRWNAHDAGCQSEEPAGCSLCCAVWTSISGCKGNDGVLYVRVPLNSIRDVRTLTHPAR